MILNTNLSFAALSWDASLKCTDNVLRSHLKYLAWPCKRQLGQIGPAAGLNIGNYGRCLPRHGYKIIKSSLNSPSSRLPISHDASMTKALFLISRFCSALAEVANLERSQSLQARECILVLAVAVRVAYKIHQFSGGFNQDCTEMFEKVRRLGQYYLRSQDPQWLKDTTRISGYRWDWKIWWEIIRCLLSLQFPPHEGMWNVRALKTMS